MFKACWRRLKTQGKPLHQKLLVSALELILCLSFALHSEGPLSKSLERIVISGNWESRSLLDLHFKSVQEGAGVTVEKIEDLHFQTFNFIASVHGILFNDNIFEKDEYTQAKILIKTIQNVFMIQGFNKFYFKDQSMRKPEKFFLTNIPREMGHHRSTVNLPFLIKITAEALGLPIELIMHRGDFLLRWFDPNGDYHLKETDSAFAFKNFNPGKYKKIKHRSLVFNIVLSDDSGEVTFNERNEPFDLYDPVLTKGQLFGHFLALKSKIAFKYQKYDEAERALLFAVIADPESFYSYSFCLFNALEYRDLDHQRKYYEWSTDLEKRDHEPFYLDGVKF